MSYCRFSSDDFQCELYCYADVNGGYTTHVAANKAIIDRSTLPPEPESFDTPEQVTKYIAHHEALMKLLENCERRLIGLPYDGQTFNDPDLESFLERLLHLRETGYKFPDYVLDRVREEIKEKQTP